MQLRILVVGCVFFVALAFGAASCASRTTDAVPTAKTKVLEAHSSNLDPVLIILEKSGDPLDETIIHQVYCPCYAMYTDEVI